MGTVVIATQSYDAYGDVASALVYLNRSASAGAAAFRAASVDDKGRALVSATDALDLESYQGNRTDPNQAHAFPRTGVSYRDGSVVVEVDPTTIPADFQSAVYELAALYAATPNLGADADTSQNIESIGGGGAPTVVFFSPTTGTRFPTQVDRLLRKFYVGGDALTAVTNSNAETRSSGTGKPDPFACVDVYPLNWG